MDKTEAVEPLRYTHGVGVGGVQQRPGEPPREHLLVHAHGARPAARPTRSPARRAAAAGHHAPGNATPSVIDTSQYHGLTITFDRFRINIFCFGH